MSSPEDETQNTVTGLSHQLQEREESDVDTEPKGILIVDEMTLIMDEKWSLTSTTPYENLTDAQKKNLQGVPGYLSLEEINEANEKLKFIESELEDLGSEDIGDDGLTDSERDAEGEEYFAKIRAIDTPETRKKLQELMEKGRLFSINLSEVSNTTDCEIIKSK